MKESKNKVGGYSTLKWLRSKRQVSMSWLQKQRKHIGEHKKYSQDEWVEFVNNSIGDKKELPPLTSITAEWSLLEREWWIAALQKDLTKDTTFQKIEEGIETYFIICNYAKDLFSDDSITGLCDCITRLIVTQVHTEADRYKLIGMHKGLFKVSVDQYKDKKQQYKNRTK